MAAYNLFANPETYGLGKALIQGRLRAKPYLVRVSPVQKFFVAESDNIFR
jgi:hypothetical protein